MYLVKESEPVEMTVFENFAKKEKLEKAEKTMEELNLRFGNEVVTTATLLNNNYLPDNRRKIKYDKK